MLTSDPAKRPSASELLASPFLRNLITDELHTNVSLRQTIHSSSRRGQGSGKELRESS
jgi:hypothetical protein